LLSSCKTSYNHSPKIVDSSEWKIEKGKLIILHIKKNFLKFRNTLKVGRGDIKADIRLARELRAEKLR